MILSFFFSLSPGIPTPKSRFNTFDVCEGPKTGVLNVWVVQYERQDPPKRKWEE